MTRRTSGGLRPPRSVSEINLALYRTFAAADGARLVNARWRNGCSSCIRCALHYEMFSDGNPWMAAGRRHAARAGAQAAAAGGGGQSVRGAAGTDVRADRRRASRRVAATRGKRWRSAMFLAIYGSPALQAAVGIDPADARR